jgi:putative glutamine amidotransferase
MEFAEKPLHFCAGGRRISQEFSLEREGLRMDSMNRAPVVFLRGQPEGVFRYVRALERAGARCRVSLDLSAAEGCDGLLLPGGGDVDPALYGQSCRGSQPPDSERDRAELALIRRFAAVEKPIFGICRGVQVLNVFFGGTLVQDLSGHSQVDGVDRIHPVHAAPESLVSSLYGTDLTVNSAHHQAVDVPGAGLWVTARSGDGVAEALEHETLPVFGVQWHPERLTGAWARPECAEGLMILRHFVEICGG